jgi:hypothetical protein
LPILTAHCSPEQYTSTLANAKANANATAMADAVAPAEMREHEAAVSAAPTEHHRSSARNLASPFSKVDEQITDAIILLNRLPNTIERRAREESSRSAQRVERSGRWVREHESELMKRVDVSCQILSCIETCANEHQRLAMFIGMRIDPKDDAMLRALLQPFGRLCVRLLC